MTDTELDDLSGVGPSTAEELADDDYTIEAIADADPDELTDYLAPGIDPEDPISDAVKATEDSESEVTEESESEATDENESEKTESSESEDDGGEELHEVDFELIDEHPDLKYAILRSVLDTELDSRRGSNNNDRHETVTELHDRLVDQFESNGPYQYPFDELTLLYTSLRDEKNKLNQQSGVSRYAGHVKRLSDEVQEVRRENFPDDN